MYKFATVVLIAAFAAPAFAQTAPAAGEKTPYVCWYDQTGKLTSAQAVQESKAPRQFVSTGHGGDKSWVYGMYSVDGKDCPARVRR